MTGSRNGCLKNGRKHLATIATRSAQQLRRIAGTLRHFPAPSYQGPSLPPAMSGDRARLQRSILLWATATVAMVLVTWMGILLHLDRPGTAICAYLIVIVLLSFMDSFIASVVFSLIAIGCLCFFFTRPRLSFAVRDPQDVVALISFLIIALFITVLVRRVRQSADSQQEQGRLLELTTDAVFALDLNRRITYWNLGAEELYGWNREEAIGRIKHQLLKTVFPEPFEELLEKCHRTGRWEGELEHTTRTGARVFVFSRWALQRDERGHATGTLEINTDITQRKLAEDALRRSQAAYLAEAQKLSQTGSFGWNVSTGEFSWSEQSFSIFGYEPSEKPFLDLVLQRTHPDDRARVQHVLASASTHKEPYDFEHRLMMPDGSIKTLRVVAHPIAEDPNQFVGAFMDVTTSKQAQLLDLTTDAVFALDLNRTITYWNRGAEELYGWNREEAIGQVKHQLLKTDFPQPFEEILETCNRTGRWEGQLEHRTRTGARVFVFSRWALQRDERGNATGTLEINTDITQRKLAEDALRRSQAAYLAEAQKLSQTGSFGWNVSSGEVSWSEQSFDIFGYDLTEKPSVDLVLRRVHPDDKARVSISLSQAATHKEPVDFEYRLMMPDGSIKTLHVVAHPTDEDPNQFIGAFMDITGSKAAYAALEQSERRYFNLFQHVPVAIWRLEGFELMHLMDDVRAKGVTDISAYIDANPDFVPRALEILRAVEVNDAAVQMFGASDRGALLGPITRIWRSRGDTIRRAIESRFRGEPVYEERAQIETLDGRLIDVLFRSTRTDFGIAHIAFVDLSDLVRAEEKLRELQTEFAHAARVATLGELTASIAHEINQPLGAIVASGEAGLRWLDRPAPDVAEVRSSLTRMHADARRASDIIARVRAMATRRGTERTFLSLDDVIGDVRLFLQHELQAHGATLSPRLGMRSGKVLADRTQIQQVVVNLVVNAIQAMAQFQSPTRKIVIGVVDADLTTLLCTVEDSGPGIKPEHFSRLFESFFTTKEGGMGIGLAICRSIIEAHGGRIAVDNESTLGGARVSFTLPMAEESKHRENRSN